MKKKLFPLALLLFLAATQSAVSQPAKEPPKTDDKAEQVLKRAVDALGGAGYLGVRSITSRGYFTPYEQGVATLPIKFVDYLVFPDRERTEFRGRGVNSVQTNTGETGWVFDGMVKKIKDLTPEQVEDFRYAMRTSLDTVLRGWWRTEGAQLSYVGRREAGVGSRNEVVRLTYADGFAVDYEFSARDGLPAKARYKRKNAEGDVVEEEDRYAQHLAVGGVSFAHVIDHYRAGVQSSRVNYEEVKFNAPVADALFARPTDVKSMK